ncbi:MAG TPA: hypothetical protein PK036_12440 [Geobacteraceae bacterium]|nr:hypothetical protein [Geobacteraceae bacterium]
MTPIIPSARLFPVFISKIPKMIPTTPAKKTMAVHKNAAPSAAKPDVSIKHIRMMQMNIAMGTENTDIIPAFFTTSPFTQSIPVVENS